MQAWFLSQVLRHITYRESPVSFEISLLKESSGNRNRYGNPPSGSSPQAANEETTQQEAARDYLTPVRSAILVPLPQWQGSAEIAANPTTESCRVFLPSETTPELEDIVWQSLFFAAWSLLFFPPLLVKLDKFWIWSKMLVLWTALGIPQDFKGSI